MKKYVILHNIRSAHNVGSIFRTADGVGVSEIFLSGYTPSPIDRFGRPQPEIKKTSLGATESVAWKNVEEIQTLISELKEKGCEIVAVEQHGKSKDYKDFLQTKDTVFIFGNEIDGVSKEIINFADVVLEIPMVGTKESLNVSVTAGIILFNTRSGINTQ